MARPYTPRGRRYVTVSGPPFGGVSRPTKNSAGMSATAARGQDTGKMSRDVHTLMVRGTLDVLGRGWRYNTEHTICPCCLQKTGPIRLRRR